MYVYIRLYDVLPNMHVRTNCLYACFACHISTVLFFSATVNYTCIIMKKTSITTYSYLFSLLLYSTDLYHVFVCLHTYVLHTPTYMRSYKLHKIRDMYCICSYVRTFVDIQY